MRRRTGLSPAPIEFFPRRFYLVVIHERTTCSIHRTRDTNHYTPNSVSTSERHIFPRTPGIHFISLREQLPPSESYLGISQTVRFNAFLTSVLNSTTTIEDQVQTQSADVGPKNVHYFFLRRRHLREEIQVIHLICRWRLLYLQLPPSEALAPFEHLPYLLSSFLSSAELLDPPNLLVSLAGIAKGLEKKLLGSARDSIREQSDDEPNLRTVSRRFIVYSTSFGESGDAIDDTKQEGDSILALKRRRISLLVILGKTHSNVSTFTAQGLEVLDISSPTTSPSALPIGDKLLPSDQRLVNRFLEACEGTEGLIAVSTSNDSGCVSAATCIGCYLMKHSNFTSDEAIGWLQFCLPVKIPMARQLFLGQMQSQMWREGERFRRTREGDFSDPLSASPTSDSTHINIGKISLGRLSLLGTRDRSRHRSDSFTASIPITTCLSSRSQESQQSPTAATTAAQLKRRPLTQGSVGSRRYHRNTDGTSLRADFALMHKFLHQTPSSTRSSSSSANSSPSSLHSVPSRPKASARSTDGTPANCTEAIA
ncbi:hypothetical protein L914_20327 [Phytophthora nicotianae]|uniref:Uncharacterized protein n=1 Tax=Phytophthora nicotianae TaxID=4792 RepID=W2M9G8_PHYNI|nr:hypothetical protein L914_20327 [Phytophthora nicotianae]